MKKKYKLIKSKLLTGWGNPLFQIKALKDFGVVKKGDLGGVIESEKNLSHDGLAWVFGNGEVSGNGRVSGDGRVSGNGKVSENGQVFGRGVVFENGHLYGDGQVFGNGQVSGYGKVFGNGRVYGKGQVYGMGYVFGNGQLFGNGRVFEHGQVYGYGMVIDNDWTSRTFHITGSRDTVSLSSYTTLTIGGITRTFKEWTKTFKTWGKENGYSSEQIKEYGASIKFVISQAPSVIKRNKAKV